jgi:hypothetical protein
MCELLSGQIAGEHPERLRCVNEKPMCEINERTLVEEAPREGGELWIAFMNAVPEVLSFEIQVSIW